jgi:hypothetical protein
MGRSGSFESDKTDTQNSISRQLRKDRAHGKQEGGGGGVSKWNHCCMFVAPSCTTHTHTFLTLHLVAVLALLHGLQRGGHEGARLGKL